MLPELFDADHYRRQIPEELDDAAALRHFLEAGDAAGLDPSPYFATRPYKQRYPDWQAQGARTAVQDFLTRIGRGRARRPHPLIDPGQYLAAYPDLAELGAGAALHFIRHGDAEGRSPSAAFDAGFYRQCYLPLGQGHAFRHYVTLGADRGHLPRPAQRSAAASQKAMRAAMAGKVRPFLLVAHDAQPAGVPILTLDLARRLLARGRSPVFLLGRAGPLLDRFAALGPVFVLAEGWDTAGLAQGLAQKPAVDLSPDPAHRRSDGLPCSVADGNGGVPALVNTAAAAGHAGALAGAGMTCLVLIHEMADYIRAQGHLPDLQAAAAAGARLSVSMPRMATALQDDLGPLEVIQPGILLPETPIAAFRRLQAWRAAQAGPVYIGAGHADHRKGFDLFLMAARGIAARRPAARFVWLGALDDWARGLADAAISEGLDLTLPGFVPDSLAWYRVADAYLLTSRQDPGPTTAIHAAAVGTPFVGYAADIGLIGLTAGVGDFVAPGDTEGFVARALDLGARQTPAARRRLRRHVRRATGFDRYVESILSRLAGATGASA